ncbi:MAG TPA: Ku protein [Pirellulales bacterium]|nr:Ku protein [Pirellulales bacterium]
MTARPTWKGHLRLSLVSVPVAAYTAAAPGKGEVHLNQLHEPCHSRIRYRKFCPLHGEVPNDEIVYGYEYAKDQYVVLEPGEREGFRSQGDRTMNIDRFVPPDTIDPLYYSGRNYYLLPEGAAADKPYRVLCQAMQNEKRCGLGQIVISGREDLALLRPLEGMLTMSLLSYLAQVKPVAEFVEEVGEGKVSADELRLARTLIQQTSADEPKLDEYEDTYTQKFKEAIEAKIAGQEVVVGQAEEEVPVVNLMDALRKSLKRGGTGRQSAAAPRPAAAARRRRKSS